MPKRSPRISAAFNIHNRRMTDAEVLGTARAVLRVLLSKMEGPPTELASWKNLARALGIRVFGFYGSPGEPSAYYDYSEYGRGKALGSFPAPKLFYNLRAPLQWRIFLIIHELAHHISAQWPDSSFPKAATERYDDIRQSAQHRVARAVEDLVWLAFFCAEDTNLCLDKSEEIEEEDND